MARWVMRSPLVGGRADTAGAEFAEDSRVRGSEFW